MCVREMYIEGGCGALIHFGRKVALHLIERERVCERECVRRKGRRMERERERDVH